MTRIEGTAVIPVGRRPGRSRPARDEPKLRAVLRKGCVLPKALYEVLEVQYGNGIDMLVRACARAAL